MRNSSVTAALFLITLGFSFPVLAQNIITMPSADAPAQQEEMPVADDAANNPAAEASGEAAIDFNNLLDKQLSESGDQPSLTTEQAAELENELIDPDFLKEDIKAYDDYNKVTLRFLNKITSESETYDLEIGKTVAYGSLRIRPQACKKSPPIEEPESVSFLQIWEKIHNEDDQWVFSGWMFASSPSLSAVEHPVYDVWVVDCKD